MKTFEELVTLSKSPDKLPLLTGIERNTIDGLRGILLQCKYGGMDKQGEKAQLRERPDRAGASPEDMPDAGGDGEGEPGNAGAWVRVVQTGVRGHGWKVRMRFENSKFMPGLVCRKGRRKHDANNDNNILWKNEI